MTARAPLILALLAVLAASVALVVSILSLTAIAAVPCHAGASSVGPVVIRDGHVSGDFKPTTEVCLP